MILNVFSYAYLPFSLVKCLFMSFAHALIGLSGFLGSFYWWVLRILYIFWATVKYVFGKYCLPGCSVSFYLFNRVFLRAKLFNFDEVQCIRFSFSGLCFWCQLLDLFNNILQNPKGTVMWFFFFNLLTW